MSQIKRLGRKPECARCRNHGVISPLRGHKRFCPYAECVCMSCVLIVQKQKVSREQIAMRRRQAQDEAAGLYLPVPETVLRGRGGNSTLATNLLALQQQFPNTNLARLHAVLKESGSLKAAVARIQREESPRDQGENLWSLSGNAKIASSPSSAAPSFSARPAPPTSTKIEDYCYYTPPPRYNQPHHIYSPYSRPAFSQSTYGPAYDGTEFPTQGTSYLMSQSPWMFADVSNYALNMSESTKNLTEFSALATSDATGGRVSPVQDASSSAFPDPSPSTISSDDEQTVLIDC